MPNEAMPSAPARTEDTATGDTTVQSAPSVRDRAPRCPPELADLLDALLGPAGARPTREQALAVLARAFPEPPPQLKLPLTPEWRVHLEELKWIHDTQLTGVWDHYAGNYLGIHGKRVIAFGPDLIELRARVEREYGISPADLAIWHVPLPFSE
jgi:hypothetical protein